MKTLKYLMLAALATSFSFGYSAGFETLLDRDLSSSEMQSFERYLENKKVVSNSKGRLTVDGEVQTKYMRLNAKKIDGTKLVGGGTNNSNSGMEARVFLNLKARADRTWADARLRFVNRLGIVGTAAGASTSKANGQSSFPKISIQAANVGYFLKDDGISTWTILAGREQLDRLFDSHLMYGTMMDGITNKYITNFSGVMDFGARLALVLLDEKTNHFGTVFQFDGLNLYDTGFYSRYSFASWASGSNNLHVDPLSDLTSDPKMMDYYWAYNISNFQVGYEFLPEALQMEANVFAEFIFNHKAKSLDYVSSGLGKQNKAWCLGAQLGKIKQKDDWLVQARYENVQAQSYPFWDASGIGRGDISGAVGSSAPATTLADYAGNVLAAKSNYRGFIVQSYYAITDELIGNVLYEQTRPIDKSLGVMWKFSQWEVRATYSF